MVGATIEKGSDVYARLINLTFGESVPHDKAHEVFRQLVKEYRNIDGFRGYAFMLMSTDRRGTALTYWDDADSASRAGERILPLMMELMRGLLAEPLEILGYEVIDQLMIDPNEQK